MTLFGRGVLHLGLRMQDVKLQVRLDGSLHEELVESAKRNHRSLNAEIIDRLKAALELEEGAKELRARLAGAEAQLADALKRLEHSEAERTHLQSEAVSLKLAADHAQEQLQAGHARHAELRAEYERATAERLKDRETYREMIRKAEDDRRRELEHVHSDLVLQRGLAERFRHAADLSDDFRILVAALLLRMTGGTDGYGDFQLDPVRLRMLATWLNEHDLRGAVHSIVALFEGAGADVIETMQAFASFLEDVDLVRSPTAAEVAAPLRDKTAPYMREIKAFGYLLRFTTKPVVPDTFQIHRTQITTKVAIPAMEVSRQKDGSVSILGEGLAISELLRDNGITKTTRIRGGISVKPGQADEAMVLLAHLVYPWRYPS